MHMSRQRWWLRVVGGLYLLQFVAMVIVKAPIAVQGPAGALERVAAGDPLARFLVETWITFGLEVAALGIGLLLASRAPERARPLVVAILAVELLRGLANDVYLLSAGGKPEVLVPWLFIHGLVLASGLWAFRRPTRDPAADTASLAARSSRMGIT